MRGSVLTLSRFLVTLRTNKRWWIPLALLTFIGVNLLGLLLPKKYEAQATVLIHEPKMQTMTGSVGMVLAINDRLDTIREEIVSYEFLKQIAHKENLDAALTQDSPEHEKLIKKMANSIELRVKEKSLFVVSYRADSPELARNITKAIVDLYLERSSKWFEKKTKDNERMIQGQLDNAKLDLKQAQAAVTQYKNLNIKEIPEAQIENLKQLAQVRAEQQSNIAQLNSLRDSLMLAKDKLTKMSQDVVSQTTSEESEEIRQLRNQKQNMELKLNTLLQDFTDDHWSVKEAKSQLKQLEKQIEKLQTGQVEKVTKSPNQVYQGLQDTILKDELEEKKLVTGIAQADKTIQTLESYLLNIPKHQAELDQLDNTRRIAEERVNSMMKYLDQAKITGAIEEQGLGPSFEVKDNPRLPQAPSSPNRMKIAAASAVMGLGAGLALVYLLMMLDAGVHTLEEARNLLQMPVLGIMQRIVASSEEFRKKRRRRRQLVGFGAGLTFLVIAAVIGLTIYYPESIQHSVESIRNLMNRW